MADENEQELKCIEAEIAINQRVDAPGSVEPIVRTAARMLQQARWQSPDQLLTANEVRKRLRKLGATDKWTNEQMKAGRFPSLSVGTRSIYSSKAIDKWMILQAHRRVSNEG
jgi:predicted DNA-binding transcriptional regulator AlpA